MVQLHPEEGDEVGGYERRALAEDLIMRRAIGPDGPMGLAWVLNDCAEVHVGVAPLMLCKFECHEHVIVAKNSFFSLICANGKAELCELSKDGRVTKFINLRAEDYAVRVG